MDGVDTWDLGVSLPRDRNDEEARLNFAGLQLLPEGRTLLGPLPGLLRLACERYIAEPDYNGGTPARATITSEDFARLWPSRDEGLLAAHLIFECRTSELPFGGAGHEGSWDKVRFHRSLSVLKYEKVQTLDEVLNVPRWTPRLADPKRLAGPHLELVKALFGEGCRDRRWPEPLDFAIRHRKLGFVRDMVDQLHGRFLEDGFSFSRGARLSTAFAAITYLDESSTIRNAIPPVARFFGEKWKQAPPDVHSVEATFEEVLGATALHPDLLVAVIMACWHEPWLSPQWYGPKGEPETWHLWTRKAAWDFRRVQTWDEYLRIRRAVFPHRVDDPDQPTCGPLRMAAVPN